MCFVNDQSEIKPESPPEVLKQAAPDKKTANRTAANALAIGTKKYRTETAIGTPGMGTKKAPSGIALG